MLWTVKYILNFRSTPKIDLSELDKVIFNSSYVTTENLKIILTKTKEEKNIEDFAMLNYYLQKKTNIKEVFNVNHISDDNFKKIMPAFLPSVEYKRQPYDSKVVYNPGDPSTNYYVILEGEVQIYNVF